MSVYSVRFGDTLSQIAQRMGASMQRLAKVNDIANVNQIDAGQKLVIPGQRDEFIPSSAAPRGPSLTGEPQGVGAAAPAGAAQPVGSAGSSDKLDLARSLIGRAYGDPAGASGEAVGPDSPFMHCAQFVNAVYPDLPPRAPELASMAQPGLEPKAGDVLTSTQPAPWGHVGIMTDKGTVIHSIPGRGVHESTLAEFEASSPVTGVIPR
ncbi:MAG TPA: LysM domain-containing protein [Myxococcaceae bacterium]|jgi:LysM repeat protein